MIWDAVWLSLRLSAVTTVILLSIGLPLAWWLATTESRVRPLVEGVTALPLVLPPTVLGFYLLLLTSPDAPLGAFWLSVTGDTLTFNFSGLVLASCLYSLPFAVQPLQTAFAGIGPGPIPGLATHQEPAGGCLY